MYKMIKIGDISNWSEWAENSKFMMGISMILFNFGSKYIVQDMSKSHEAFLGSTIIRRMTLFSMFFVATKDLKLSLTMTAAFIILALGLFNEKSPISVLPASLFDNVVTDQEYALAKELISKYEKAKK